MVASPFKDVEMLLLFELVRMSLLLVDTMLVVKPGFRIDFRVLPKFSGGKNAGNENPAAAAAWSDCKSAAECSCALRRSSATDVVRGSFADDDVVTPAELVIIGERFEHNDEIDDVVDDVIVGQHEHKPGNPEGRKRRNEIKNYIERNHLHFVL